ncbi:MAG: alpha/beta hydrolase [Pseudomonadota bacterium]
MSLTRRTFLAAPAFLAGCTPLGVLNTVVPEDGGARRVATSIAYGPLPRQGLDIYAPTAAARAPVIVFFYGGSWSSGRKEDYSFVASAFASAGYVCVLPDYRLFPAVRFPAFLEDCALATAWVERNIARFGGDPSRLFLAGHSAGAYNAVMVGLDRRYLDAAGGSQAAIRGVAGLAGPYDFLPLDNRTTINVFGEAPRLDLTQPVNFARRGLPPFFLATGADDDTVFPRNTIALAKRLRGVSVPVTEKIYPGVGHAGILLALSVPLRGRAPVLADMLDFFRGASA